MDDRPIDPEAGDEDREFDHTLRPKSLAEMLGQEKTKQQLGIAIEAARQRDEAMDHVLLYGPPGLGKTTLSYVIAKELGVEIYPTSGPLLDRPSDLAGMLTTMGPRDVLFIDEIHRVNRVVEEYLYSAMEDYTIDIMLDKGPSARSVQLNLNPFTLVGATTRLGNLTSPMRDRFGVILRLDFYSDDELLKIITRSADILDIKMDEDGALEIARRSRGTPRIANRILRRARDFAQVKTGGVISKSSAKEALDRLGIDENGLDDMDRRILSSLVKNFNGGPVGLDSLGVAISEDARTIEEVYEPFLIKEGYIKRTSRGRQAMEKTYTYLNLDAPNSAGQVDIF